MVAVLPIAAGVLVGGSGELGLGLQSSLGTTLVSVITCTLPGDPSCRAVPGQRLPGEG